MPKWIKILGLGCIVAFVLLTAVNIYHRNVAPVLAPGFSDFSYKFQDGLEIIKMSGKNTFLGVVEPRTNEIVSPTVLGIAEIPGKLIVSRNPKDDSRVEYFIVDRDSLQAQGPLDESAVAQYSFRPIKCYAPYFINDTFSTCGPRLFLRRLLPNFLL